MVLLRTWKILSKLIQLERGSHDLEPLVITNFPTKKYSDVFFPSSEDAEHVWLFYYKYGLIITRGVKQDVCDVTNKLIRIFYPYIFSFKEFDHRGLGRETNRNMLKMHGGHGSTNLMVFNMRKKNNFW